MASWGLVLISRRPLSRPLNLVSWVHQGDEKSSNIEPRVPNSYMFERPQQPATRWRTQISCLGQMPNASRSRQSRPSVKQSSTAIIAFTDAECAGFAVNSMGSIERIYLHQALVYEVLHNQKDPRLNYKSKGQFGYRLYHCLVPSLQGGPLYKPFFREPMSTQTFLSDACLI